MNTRFRGASAGFDHPLEMLDDCHESILHHCKAIEHLAVHVYSRGVDAQARAAALTVIRYFDTTGANHHLDEEEDIFPALQHHAPQGELHATFGLIFRLRTEHKNLDTLWTDLRARLNAIVEGRSGGITKYMAAVFRQAYERHIAAEEGELMPLARRVLPREVLVQVGERMARRRGVDLKP